MVELRLDGSRALRFRDRYLKYAEVTADGSPGGAAPRPREFNAVAADASLEEESPSPGDGAGPTRRQPTGATLRVPAGRTPAEPYPPDGAGKNNGKASKRPAEDHPWRKPFNQQK